MTGAIVAHSGFQSVDFASTWRAALRITQAYAGCESAAFQARATVAAYAFMMNIPYAVDVPCSGRALRGVLYYGMVKIVYMLKDSTGTPIYIGQTANLKRRENEHRKWINEEFSIHALESCDSTEKADISERFYISILSRQYSLLNTTDNPNRGTCGVAGPQGKYPNSIIEFKAYGHSSNKEKISGAGVCMVNFKLVSDINCTKTEVKATYPIVESP